MKGVRSVAIGVCTAHRPTLLTLCLTALRTQTIPQDCALTLIVVDNEPEPNNQQLVTEFADTCPFAVRYVHEARRGISQARNAVLAEAEHLGAEWIAFTDDDCQPAGDWIACLVEAAERHKADVIYGSREWIPPDPVPFWFTMPNPRKGKEGDVLRAAATHNVLMSRQLADLRFDERLAHGEDADLFFRAFQRGARIVCSTQPVVREMIPLARATLRYQLKRGFWQAASQSDFDRRHGLVKNIIRKRVVRLVWQVPLSIGRLLFAPLLLPFGLHLFKRQVRKGLRSLVGLVGALVGLAGFIGNPYPAAPVARRAPTQPWGSLRPNWAAKISIAAVRQGVVRGAFKRPARRMMEWFGPCYDIEIRGVKLRCRVDDNATERLIVVNDTLRRSFEQPRIIDGLNRGDTFVDIGANCGLFSLFAARSVGPTGRVISIEPVRTIAARMRFNIALNGFGNIEVFETAVGNDVGEATLYILEKEHGQTSMVEVNGCVPTVVPMTTLLSLVESTGITRMDAMKIDIEGYEDRALIPFFEEAPTLLWPRRIFMEIRHRNRWVSDCLGLLLRLGYQTEWQDQEDVLLVRKAT
jgi:FkbM family methyltransferase